MRVLIDADPIVYRTGFASQTTWKLLKWSDVVVEDDPSEDVNHSELFVYAWEVDAFVEDMNLAPDEYQVVEHVDPQELGHCLKIVKDTLRNIQRAMDGFLAESGEKVTTTEIYLTGSTNFRNKVATIPGKFTKEGDPVLGYKANRGDKRRPYWYEEIRTYLKHTFAARVVDGIEADDALSIAQWGGIGEFDDEPSTVIVTIDKDLLNVPGWHYNPVTKKDKYITIAHARANFWRQVVTGDASDNIPGLYRVGPATAAKSITMVMDDEECYQTVLEMYAKAMDKAPERYLPHTDPAAAVLENARLLWMLQHEDQLWTPPGQPDASIAAAGLLDETLAEQPDE